MFWKTILNCGTASKFVFSEQGSFICNLRMCSDISRAFIVFLLLATVMRPSLKLIRIGRLIFSGKDGRNGISNAVLMALP